MVMGKMGAPTLQDEIVDTLMVLSPLLIVFILLVIFYYIYQAAHDKRLTGAVRTECKRQIIIALRQKISGMTMMEIAKSVNMTREQTEDILEEMKSERQIYETRYNGKTVWCMKGISDRIDW